MLTTGTPSEQRQVIQRCVERITIAAERIDLQLAPFAAGSSHQTSSIAARLVRRGFEVRLALAPEVGGDRLRDPALIKILAKAHAARKGLDRADGRSLSEAATEQGFTRNYFALLIRLSYLAPDITAAILDGRQPVQLNRQRLARATNLPFDWQSQREMLGFT